MLARLVRPCHRWLPLRLVGAVAVMAVVIPLPRCAWSDTGFEQGLLAALLVTALGLAHPRVACAVGAGVLAAGGCCWLAGGSGQAGALMLLLAGAAAPLTLGWKGPGTSSSDAALGLSGMLLQAAVLCVLPLGWPVVLALAMGGALCLLAPVVMPLPVPAPARPDPPPVPRQMLPLPRPRDVLRLLAKLALVAVVATLVLLHPALPSWHEPAVWLTLGTLLVMWTMVTGSAVTAAVIVGCELLALGLVRAPAGTDELLLGILAPAQIMPLTVRWWRFWRTAPVRAGVVALWLPGLISARHPEVVLLAGAAAAFASAPWPSSWRPGPSSPRQAIAAARGLLSIYWAWYLPMKWRLDPMFGQLRADARAWGRVLDAGCGPGLGALLAVTRPGTRVYCGIDLDEEKLLVARHLLAAVGHPLDDSCRLILGRMPFATPLSERYDTVLLLDVLHYWHPEQQRLLLAQLRAACTDDGELWLREGVADEAGSAGRVGGGERFTTYFSLNPGSGTLFFQSRERLEGWLREAGWMVLESQPSGAENRLWRLRAGQAASAPG